MSEALNAGDGLLVSAAEDDLTGSVTNTGGNAWVTFNPAVARDDVIRQLTAPDAFPGRVTIPHHPLTSRT